MKNFGILILGLSLALALWFSLGCASAQQTATTIKDAVQLGQDACVVIHDVAPNDQKGQAICAKEAELQPYVKLILGGRARPQVVDGGTGK